MTRLASLVIVALAFVVIILMVFPNQSREFMTPKKKASPTPKKASPTPKKASPTPKKASPQPQKASGALFSPTGVEVSRDPQTCQRICHLKC
jgi:cytoskeletal protein RodZ